MWARTLMLSKAFEEVALDRKEDFQGLSFKDTATIPATMGVSVKEHGCMNLSALSSVA